jgi:putative phosphoribosyl transferase
MVELPFRDRSEAGRILGLELATRKLGANPIILALARGGVPVGAEVADILNAPLDVVVVRKLGVPWQPELAMGAIAGSTRILDPRTIHDLGLSGRDVEAVVAQETKEAQRREKLYRGGLQPPDIRNRAVVLVDDGLATGATMTAAARHVHSLHPEKLTIAVPVGSSDACRLLRREADECICLAEPEPFFAVGEWYVDFRQVTDSEVEKLLKRAHGLVEAGAPG